MAIIPASINEIKDDNVCKTHRNIAAEVIKGQQVTLEESVRQSPTFKDKLACRMLVQLSAAHDQPVYMHGS